MKKIAIALMCTILATGAAMAQPAKKFTFGPKVGFDLTHFWGKHVVHDVKFGYQAGAFAEFGVTNKFAIAPEVVFAAQGGKGDHVSYTTNYINIPVMLKFYVAPDFSIDFGPQVGINVYSKCDGEDVSDATKSVDFGAGLGATYNLARDVFVQARYTMGFTEVFKVGEAKNGNAQIAIGYRF